MGYEVNNLEEVNNRCGLCGDSSQAVFTSTIRLQHPVTFYQCGACGLLQSEKPYWLGEAYGKAISALDTGILKRNLAFRQIVAIFLRFFGDRHGTFLDYGGGHGIFTRLMRDNGYDFRWHDRYAENLYANGFEYEDNVQLAGVTAFEVLEHLENPKDFFDDLLGRLQPKLFLASTMLFEEPVDPAWHYLYPESGQHIAFYQKKTIEFVAKQYGYYCASWRYFHVFSKKPLSPLLVKFIIPFARVAHPFVRFNSLHLKDQKQILEKLKDND